MDTTLLVLLDGIYKRVDLYEDIPISVIIQQADITALDTRKSPYSKQFVVPNTNNNAIVFEHYFEVNGTEFNPLTKIQCVVQYRGVDIFNGLLRLSAVIENSTHTDFEVYIMGVVGDFASEIRNITLQDLQFMLNNAANTIKDWTRVSRVNKGMTIGTSFNILSKSLDKLPHILAITNMIWDFGEYLPNYSKPVTKGKKSTTTPYHQEPIFN